MNNTLIKKITAEGRNFTVVFNKEYNKYLAIEEKYITDGKLNQQLNGLQMHARDTLEECIQETEMTCKIDKMKEAGMDQQEILNEIRKMLVA